MIPVFFLSEKKCRYAVAVHNVSLPATGVRRVWVPVTGHAGGICGKELLSLAKGVLGDTPGKLFKLHMQNPAFWCTVSYFEAKSYVSLTQMFPRTGDLFSQPPKATGILMVDLPRAPRPNIWGSADPHLNSHLCHPLATAPLKFLSIKKLGNNVLLKNII